MNIDRGSPKGNDDDALLRGEDQDGRITSIADMEVSDRLGFIRKVYSILSVQLLVTFGGISYVKLDPQVDEAMRPLWGWGLFAFFISFFVEIAIICC